MQSTPLKTLISIVPFPGSKTISTANAVSTATPTKMNRAELGAGKSRKIVMFDAYIQLKIIYPTEFTFHTLTVSHLFSEPSRFF